MEIAAKVARETGFVDPDRVTPEFERSVAKCNAAIVALLGKDASDIFFECEKGAAYLNNLREFQASLARKGEILGLKQQIELVQRLRSRFTGGDSTGVNTDLSGILTPAQLDVYENLENEREEIKKGAAIWGDLAKIQRLNKR